MPFNSQPQRHLGVTAEGCMVSRDFEKGFAGHWTMLGTLAFIQGWFTVAKLFKWSRNCQMSNPILYSMLNLLISDNTIRFNSLKIWEDEVRQRWSICLYTGSWKFYFSPFMTLKNFLACRKPISRNDFVVSVRYLYRQYRKSYIIKYINEDLIW